ncbi:MAG: imidazole glycerol phosphate synthase subunit HisH [Gammaproteobacteria bacterium]|nr:imidazole glycerol phosphate synthase subunit HisH [Gammaproteobacteria bacterium]
MTIAIVDCGGANTASVRFALQRQGCDGTVTHDAGLIRAASLVIVPGVGAIDDTMQRLQRHRLDEVIPTLTQPVLGICLGMQILGTRSDEGESDCLGIVDNVSRRLHAAQGRPVPHTGWNRAQVSTPDPLFQGIGNDNWFYYVHSYALAPGPDTIATTMYGQRFSAALRRRNFYGVQFHPERSGRGGAKLIGNFLQLAGRDITRVAS